MYKKSLLIVFVFVSYFQFYAQDETIRSFTTSSFEVTFPQTAIIELGIGELTRSFQYINGGYSFNEKFSINFEFTSLPNKMIYEDMVVLLSASFNVTNNFTIGPYHSFYNPRIGLFSSYGLKLFSMYLETKIGGDIYYSNKSAITSDVNYFMSLSSKKRILKKLQLIGEICYTNNSPQSSYVNKYFLFSIGSQYQIFNSINIRGMLGYNQLGDDDKVIAQLGINYIFK